MKPPPCVLTIAGSDSGAGAGIQADARAIHALGGYACTAISAITAQNTRGILRWQPVAPSLLAAQIEAVLDDLPIRAIKTGLLPGAAAVRAVAAALEQHPGMPLVIDPVLGSTGGTAFLRADGIAALRRFLLPRATVVTPNWPEAEILSGREIRSYADAVAAARLLAAGHGCAVLVKGGHGPGRECRDCLVAANGRVRWFTSRRVATPNTHGTGCVLSAGMAAGLARGDSLLTAIRRAHGMLESGLRKGARVAWGGVGPAFPGARR